MPTPGYFLKVAGIPGESLDAKHKGSIELDSYALMMGGAGGDSPVSPLRVTALKSIADPKIMRASLDSTSIKIDQIVLTCRLNGSPDLEHNIWTFTNCRIRHFVEGSKGESNGGGDFQGVPKPNTVVSYEIVFEKAVNKTHEIKSDGTLGAATQVSYDRGTRQTK